MHNLLIEIGTEELPASIIQRIATYLDTKVREIIKPEVSHVFFTPRRIALLMRNFQDLEGEHEEILIGPPKKACYDGNNQPTKALLRFLETNKAHPKDLMEVERKGGIYIALRRVQKTKKPTQLLIESFQEILTSAPVPKSMRWTSSQTIKFPRPIRWVCALCDEQILPIKFGNLIADKKTYGHRFLSKGEIQISNPLEYEQKLKLNYVIPDYQERIRIIKKSIQEKAESLDGFVEDVEGLYEEVANLVEYPFVVVGRIEEKFLVLPEKVIVTVLAHHQRFFCLKGRDSLLPYFIAVSNNLPKDERIVKGYEKVIRARLEDALFFYREDLKTKLEDLVPKLSHVIFHPKAGSMLDKTNRLIHLSEKISKHLGLSKDYISKVKRAAYLSKADILTNMVRELNELQGYMGYVYARAQGEDEEVAKALWEQYLPNPSSITGKILSLADKIDNIYTLIGLGEMPTGKSDPYGLRRSAQVIFTIIEEEGWDLDIGKLLPTLPESLIEFLKSRLRAYLDKFPHDVVEAVLEVCSPLTVAHCIHSVRKITELKNDEKFKGIVQAYKRISKILPKDFKNNHVKEELFTESYEMKLWQKLRQIEKECTSITDLYALEEPIKEFFDKVLIMDKDEKIRNNRLSLLLRTKELFNNYADFSKIVYEQ